MEVQEESVPNNVNSSRRRLNEYYIIEKILKNERN